MVPAYLCQSAHPGNKAAKLLQEQGKAQRSLLGTGAISSEVRPSKSSSTCRGKDMCNSVTGSGRSSELVKPQEMKPQRWVETVHLGVLNSTLKALRNC